MSLLYPHFMFYVFMRINSDSVEIVASLGFPQVPTWPEWGNNNNKLHLILTPHTTQYGIDRWIHPSFLLLWESSSTKPSSIDAKVISTSPRGRFLVWYCLNVMLCKYPAKMTRRSFPASTQPDGRWVEDIWNLLVHWNSLPVSLFWSWFESIQ